LKVLVTGSSGFIGTGLIARLIRDNRYRLNAAGRQPAQPMQADVRYFAVGDLSRNTNWHTALNCVDTVVHLAAHVHVVHDRAQDPVTLFRQINVEGTINLVRQAAENGVRRIIFLSSVKVSGEMTTLDKPFTPEAAAPADPYAISKYEAENMLRELCRDASMELVIIRPPLVYGPGVKANFNSLLRLVASGIPLPFGAIVNRRSLVARDNLVDLIATCIEHPAASNEIFLVSDGEDLSTPELICRLAQAMNRPARLFSMPQFILTGAAGLIGKKDIMQRLCGSLWLDIGKTRDRLGWKPPVTVDRGLEMTALWYLQQGRRRLL
jgi:UDP-glucose 4-epimerase